MTDALSAGMPIPREPADPLPLRRPRDLRLIAGLAIIAFAVSVAVGAPRLAPFDPRAYPAVPLAHPSLQHPLGANDTGQDLLSQLIYSTRVSLFVGVVVGIVSTAVASVVGLLSGLSRRADALVVYIVDLMLVLPPLLIVILIASYLGAGLTVVVTTLCIVSWGPFARLIRGQVQRELRRPYVEAARALGVPGPRLLWRHIAPATIATIVVKFVTTVQYALVVQASLAFLGLGDPTAISWGATAHRAAHSPIIFLNWTWLWWLLPPALAIAIVVVGFALIGWSIEGRSRPGRGRVRVSKARKIVEPE